jgi:hypothetical protein
MQVVFWSLLAVLLKNYSKLFCLGHNPPHPPSHNYCCCLRCCCLRVLRQMFFTIDKQARCVQNNPGYDAMSSCNCTVNIVINNVDTVYDMSFMIWGMWSSHLDLNVYSILLTQRKRMAHALVALKLKMAVSQNTYRAVKSRARALTSCIACYCTATTFQFRRLLVSRSAILKPYIYGCECKGQQYSWLLIYGLGLSWTPAINLDVCTNTVCTSVFLFPFNCDTIAGSTWRWQRYREQGSSSGNVA